MSLQNRVLPTGEIVESKARGTLMGNRGVLHNSSKQVIKHYKIKPWITCLLEFKGRKRELMAPNRYTELFFLDEVTAFAAGHRPCAECRRQRYNEFRDAWAALLWKGEGKPKAGDIDTVLHQERVDANNQKIVWESELNALPVGSMFSVDGNNYAVHEQGVLRWSGSGYVGKVSFQPNEKVTVLTPKSITKLFSAGFNPQFHFTAK